MARGFGSEGDCICGMGFTLNLLYAVLVLKLEGSDSGLFLHSMELIHGLLRTLMATVDDQDTLELLEDIIA